MCPFSNSKICGFFFNLSWHKQMGSEVVIVAAVVVVIFVRMLLACYGIV